MRKKRFGDWLWGRFTPEIYVNSVLEINFEELKSLGIKGLLLDVDNTLKAHYSVTPTAEVRGWLDAAQAAGFELCLVSNGYTSRIEPFAHGLGLRAVGEAMKPSPAGFRRAAALLGLQISETCVVGDQLFTDIWGGNKAGAHTLLVKPISKDEPFYLRMKRHFEKLILNKPPE